MFLSIIIPCYNVEYFVKDLCYELSKSNFFDIEFIFVDDCSNDNTRDIIKSYQDFDDRFKLIENRKNMGLSDTREIGVKNSVGKYLCFLDGDDLINLDNLIKGIEKYENEFDTFIVGYEKFEDNTGKVLKSKEPKTFLHKVVYNQAPMSMPILQPCWTHIHESKFYKSNLKYIGREREDRDFALRSFIKSKSIVVANDIIVHKYRINRKDNNSIMQKELTFNGLFYFLEHLSRFFIEIENLIKNKKDHGTYMFCSKYLESISWEMMNTLNRMTSDLLLKNISKISEVFEIYIKNLNEINRYDNIFIKDINFKILTNIVFLKSSIDCGYVFQKLMEFKDARHLENFLKIIYDLPHDLQKNLLDVGKVKLDTSKKEIFISPKERKKLKLFTGFLRKETFNEVYINLIKKFPNEKFGYLDSNSGLFDIQDKDEALGKIKENLLFENNIIFIPTEQLIKFNPVFLEKLGWIFEIELIFFKENLFHMMAWDFSISNKIENYFEFIFKDNGFWIMQKYNELKNILKLSKSQFIEIGLNNTSNFIILNKNKIDFKINFQLLNPKFLCLLKYIAPFNNNSNTKYFEKLSSLCDINNLFANDISTYLFYWKKIGVQFFSKVYNLEKSEINTFFKFNKPYKSDFELIDITKNNDNAVEEPDEKDLKIFYKIISNLSKPDEILNKKFNTNYSMMNFFKLGSVKVPESGIVLNNNNFFCFNFSKLKKISISFSLIIKNNENFKLLSAYSNTLDNLFSTRIEDNKFYNIKNDLKITSDFVNELSIDLDMNEQSTTIKSNFSEDVSVTNDFSLFCIGGDFFDNNHSNLNYIIMKKIKINSLVDI